MKHFKLSDLDILKSIERTGDAVSAVDAPEFAMFAAPNVTLVQNGMTAQSAYGADLTLIQRFTNAVEAHLSTLDTAHAALAQSVSTTMQDAPLHEPELKGDEPDQEPKTFREVDGKMVVGLEDGSVIAVEDVSQNGGLVAALVTYDADGNKLSENVIAGARAEDVTFERMDNGRMVIVHHDAVGGRIDVRLVAPDGKSFEAQSPLNLPATFDGKPDINLSLGNNGKFMITARYFDWDGQKVFAVKHTFSKDGKAGPAKFNLDDATLKHAFVGTIKGMPSEVAGGELAILKLAHDATNGKDTRFVDALASYYNSLWLFRDTEAEEDDTETKGPSDADDTLEGGAGRNLINGLGGDDIIDGNAGNDTLLGGFGHDRLKGGDGFDLLLGGQGDDTLDGGAGDDVLHGDDGADTLDGGAGNDTLHGGGSADVLDAGEGDDSLFGGNGADSLSGGAGNDALDGGGGSDTLQGGDGNDELSGQNGDDRLTGDAGNDRLYGGMGDDIIRGGKHDDWLYGGDGSDMLNGGADNDNLFGGAGADVFVFNNRFGSDVVRDFNVNDDGDKIDLSGVKGIEDWDDLKSNHMVQSGNHVLITNGDDTIKLLNIDLKDLETSDFIF